MTTNELIRRAKECGLLDELAALEHEQWMGWARAVANEVSKERLARWQQYFVPYDMLPDDVQELDREWAEHVLRILHDYGWIKEDH